ncbi:MAG: hypothetical protein ACKOCX_06885 [Planctomycetota bacterium]
MTSRNEPAPPAPPGFDDFVAGFLGQVFDLDPARARLRPAAMEQWPTETDGLVAAAGPGFGRRRQDREARLAANLEAVVPLVTVESLPSFVAHRLDIAAVPDFASLADAEPCYVKINHGFWEQLYALFGRPDAERMRIKEPARFRTQYVESAFVDALAVALGRVARPEAHRLRFPGMHLGVSLASGSHDHPELLARFTERSAARRSIVLGAAIGVVAWWETLCPGLQPAFCDGSFPKRGLATGALQAALDAAAERSERIVFVVPPHLAGIRLAGARIPQETVLVPPTTVHESWAACLAATAGHVLARVAAEGRVLVITQSAVFSALLGAFLLDARRTLLPPDARLRFFDLGQALDVAAPAAGGPWARQQETGGRDLFHLAAD